ncbi:MAG: NAD(+) diphosphatase [Pseudoclavibacter sp.]
MGTLPTGLSPSDLPLADLPLVRGGLALDTAARTEPDLFDRLWDEPGTRVLVLHDGRAPVRGGALRWIDPADTPATLVRAYLGRIAGAARVAVNVGEGSFAEFSARPAQQGTAWSRAREVGAGLPPADSTALVTATALFNWHATHGFCPHCGMPTAVGQAGWVRRCPSCGHTVFPRIEPAVIMTVEDADGRLLLASHGTGPDARFSVLAGFVEPGESLRQAVVREVAEEVGLRVRVSAPLGSQPWPYPLSLMVAFRAETLDDPGRARPDGDEIAQLRWVTRDELPAAGLRLPPAASIAAAMIAAWRAGAR